VLSKNTYLFYPELTTGIPVIAEPAPTLLLSWCVWSFKHLIFKKTPKPIPSASLDKGTIWAGEEREAKERRRPICGQVLSFQHGQNENMALPQTFLIEKIIPADQYHDLQSCNGEMNLKAGNFKSCPISLYSHVPGILYTTASRVLSQ